jgi:hypothetical protein
VFRECDLVSRASRFLARSGDSVTVSKPCPHCGNEQPLVVRLPGHVFTNARSWRLAPFPAVGADD